MQASLSYAAPNGASDAVLLIVGDIARWRRAGRKLPDLDGLVFAEMCDLTACLMHQVKPDIVVSPVIATGFDVVDLARFLHETGYLGQYRAISDGLPNLSIIRREVRQVAPRLDFSVIDVKTLML